MAKMGMSPKRPPKVEEPVLSIREIPKPPPSEPRELIPTEIPQPAFDSPAALARAQRLLARVNLSRMITTLFALTQRAEDHRRLYVLLEKEEAELREVAATLADRPESLTLAEYFRAGDVLLTFGPNSLDPERPRAFTEALRDWIATAQPGATILATVRRKDRTLL